MRGVARGARLPKSRFGSTLELLSYIRIWYFERENRELVRINQCELIESFLDVQSDYQAGIYLALISEVTERRFWVNVSLPTRSFVCAPGGQGDSQEWAISGCACLFLLVDGAAGRLARSVGPLLPMRKGQWRRIRLFFLPAHCGVLLRAMSPGMDEEKISLSAQW